MNTRKPEGHQTTQRMFGVVVPSMGTHRKEGASTLLVCSLEHVLTSVLEHKSWRLRVSIDGDGVTLEVPRSFSSWDQQTLRAPTWLRELLHHASSLGVSVIRMESHAPVIPTLRRRLPTVQIHRPKTPE